MTSSFLHQLTVYTDVKAATQLEFIQGCARRLCSTSVVVPLTSLSGSSSSSSSSALLFMKLWEKQREDAVRVVRNDVPFFNQFECFITSGQSLSSGEVTYALYRRQMPVLSLGTEAEEAPCLDKPNGNNGGGGGGRETCALGPRTAVQGFLYHERHPSLSVEEAIQQFFTFPKRMGVLFAVECDECGAAGGGEEDGSSSPSSSSALRFAEVCEALRRLYHESPLFPDSERLLLLGSDGYPLAQPPAIHPGAHGEGGAGRVLPSPAPPFEGLLRTLTSARNEGSGADAGEEGGFLDLLQQNPQLFGALFAFNRYENRGLLRYLLHRGYCPAILDHTSSTAAQLARVMRGEAAHASSDAARGTQVVDHPTAASVDTFNKHLASLSRFEGHWMDMALPKYTICLSTWDNNKRHSTTDSSSWLRYMPPVEGKQQVRGPGGDAWDVLPVDATASPESAALSVAKALHAKLQERNDAIAAQKAA